MKSPTEKFPVQVFLETDGQEERIQCGSLPLALATLERQAKQARIDSLEDGKVRRIGFVFEKAKEFPAVN